jgi:hypothetical protein
MLGHKALLNKLFISINFFIIIQELGDGQELYDGWKPSNLILTEKIP